MEPNLATPVSHPHFPGTHPRSHMAQPKTKYVCKYMKIDVYESKIIQNFHLFVNLTTLAPSASNT
jgi:hypothetical protein